MNDVFFQPVGKIPKKIVQDKKNPGEQSLLREMKRTCEQPLTGRGWLELRWSNKKHSVDIDLCDLTSMKEGSYIRKRCCLFDLQ